MNLLLLTPEEAALSPIVLTQQDRRHQHLRAIQRVVPDQLLRVGILNGPIGQARVVRQDAQGTLLELLQLDQPAPQSLPVTLLLALPRPKMLARSLQHMTAMGVKQLYLIASERVEKSFWQSPEVKAEKIHQQLLLGLEQARDTLLPQVHLIQDFRQCLHHLPAISAGTRKLLAHPGDYPFCPRGLNEPVTLAIGPEGGFIEREVSQLCELGFEPVQLGARILRVETAVTALLARLF